MRVRTSLWLALAASTCVAPAAWAHGGVGSGAVETRFELPPWVAWATGALVVAASYALVAGFQTRSDAHVGRPLAAAPAPERRRPRFGPWAGLLVWLVVLAHALQPGRESATPAALLWLLVWGALPIVAYVVGNPWPHVSPFHALARVADRYGPATRRRYPRGLGAWPSVVLLVALIGLEPLLGGGDDASRLATLLAAYTILTFAGMLVYGGGAWLEHAEVFDRFFRWWSALAPVVRHAGSPAAASSLQALRIVSGADVAFAVGLLYGVNFDGLLATPQGTRALAALTAPLGDAAGLAALLLGYGAFLGLFWLAAAGVRRFAQTLEPTRLVAARFAATLLPIAAGYHAAHNPFHVIENAPLLLHVVNDPLGRGWDLLGISDRARRFVLPPRLGVAFAAAQMALIVAGHVLAVVVAHRLAESGFPSRVQALRAETPLAGVMVAYTLVGLWIVSQAAAGTVTG